MKPIPTKVHGLLDYTTGALFIASPWLLDFADDDAARSVAVGTGVAVLGLSVFTDYEAGVTRRIPMATHLTVDTLSGVLVAASGVRQTYHLATRSVRCARIGSRSANSTQTRQ